MRLRRKGSLLASTAAMLSGLVLLGVAGGQLLLSGLCVWEAAMAVVLLDNNGRAVCRALERDLSSEWAAATVQVEAGGPVLLGAGVRAGRAYAFYRQPSPDTGRQAVYRSVAVNGGMPGVNPLTDPNSVAVTAWQVYCRSGDTVEAVFELEDIRTGRRREYEVLLTLYNARESGGAGQF